MMRSRDRGRAGRHLAAQRRHLDAARPLRPGRRARRLRRRLLVGDRRPAPPEVVVKGIEALKAVWHRGCRRCRRQDRRRRRHPRPDRRSDFFQRKSRVADPAPTSASRSAWCSCRAPASSSRRPAARIVESEILSFGYAIRGWRQVPVDTSVSRREGHRHPARDRADHRRQPQGRSTRTSSSATSI